MTDVVPLFYFSSFLFSFLFGSKQPEQKRKKNDELGQIVVSGALDDTKTIGKAGADIFANFGAEKP